MLLLEDQETQWGAKQAQYLGKPKGKPGSQTFPVFPLPLESISEESTPESLLIDRTGPGAAGQRGQKWIFIEVTFLSLPWFQVSLGVPRE
jgi:hypothetical protein